MEIEQELERNEQKKAIGLEFARKLQVLSNFYTQHPTLPPVYSISNTTIDILLWSGQYSKEEITSLFKEIGGKKATDSVGHFIGLRKELSPGVSIFINCNRETICERIIVRTEKKLKQVPLPVQFQTKEVEEEIVEWKCPESFFDS